MKNFNWKGTAIVCGILTILVIARCAVTVGFVRYYGGSYWMSKVMQDPWFYIGMASAALCAVSLLALVRQDRKDNETRNDGCED